MSYTLIQDLTKVNFTPGNKGRKYIVIHYTGNKTDTAEDNANYFRNTKRGSSAHYFVDDTTVYQVVSDADTALAQGKNYGKNNLFGIVTNGNALSIEMCGTNGRVSDATFNNTIALTQTLMKKYNIPASNVVRHYDVASKHCPGWAGWLPGNEAIWNDFKSRLSKTAGGKLDMTECIIWIKDDHAGYAKGTGCYWSPATGVIPLPSPDCIALINIIRKNDGLPDICNIESSSGAPWVLRAQQASMQSSMAPAQKTDAVVNVDKVVFDAKEIAKAVNDDAAERMKK